MDDRRQPWGPGPRSQESVFRPTDLRTASRGILGGSHFDLRSSSSRSDTSPRQPQSPMPDVVDTSQQEDYERSSFEDYSYEEREQDHDMVDLASSVRMKKVIDTIRDRGNNGRSANVKRAAAAFLKNRRSEPSSKTTSAEPARTPSPTVPTATSAPTSGSPPASARPLSVSSSHLDAPLTSAMTTIMVPFTTRTAGNESNDSSFVQDPGETAAQMLAREFVDSRGEVFKMWRTRDVHQAKTIRELGDLSPQFRHLMGSREKGRPAIETWRSRTLKLTKPALSSLLRDARLWAASGGSEVGLEVIFQSVQVILFPMGVGVLNFKLNWSARGTSAATTLTSDQIITYTYLVKQMHPTGAVRGWTFADWDSPSVRKVGEKSATPGGAAFKGDGTGTAKSDHEACLGRVLHDAKHKQTPCSLYALSCWLLLLPGERPIRTAVRRVDRIRTAYHHSSVVLKLKPSKRDLDELLFYLRRAYGQTNRPPWSSSSESDPTDADRVLVLRSNRIVGVSRDGNVSISWPYQTPMKQASSTCVISSSTSSTSSISSTASSREEASREASLHNLKGIQQWEKKFHRLFAKLALHSKGEKTVLEELEYAVALVADRLHLGEEDSIKELEILRDYVRDIALKLLKFMMSMGSADCGGTSEVYLFYSAIRLVFKMEEKRMELKEKLHDLLALVESSHRQQAAKHKEIARMQLQRKEMQHKFVKAAKARRQAKKKKLQKERKKYKENSQQFIGVIITIFSAITIPLVLVAGCLGMNNENTPIDWSWYAVLGYTLLFSVVLFLTILCVQAYFWYNQRKLKEKMAEQKRQQKDHLAGQIMAVEDVDFGLTATRSTPTHVNLYETGGLIRRDQHNANPHAGRDTSSFDDSDSDGISRKAANGDIVPRSDAEEEEAYAARQLAHSSVVLRDDRREHPEVEMRLKEEV